MKRTIEQLSLICKRQSGQALLLAMIMLAVGSLLIAPLMGLITTSLNVGMVVEEDVDAYYAADAGVEDALNRLRLDYTNPSIPKVAADPSYSYPLPATINGRSVGVVISLQSEEDKIYRIISTAPGSSVDAVVQPSGWFGGLLNQAITTAGDVKLSNDSSVVGGMVSGSQPPPSGTGGYGTYDTWEDFNTNPVDHPPPNALRNFYWLQAMGLADPSTYGGTSGFTYTPESSITPTELVGGVCAGNLTVRGPQMIDLTGTLFVDGKLTMGPDDMQIRLNGNTIYVTGEIEIKNGGGLKTLGSGCIIAEGNITYRTNGESDPNGFLFLMSVNGIVKIDNGDSIYGSIASFGSGANEIDLKNGSDITFDGRPSDGTLNFPGANENDLFAFGEKIVFWKVE